MGVSNEKKLSFAAVLRYYAHDFSRRIRQSCEASRNHWSLTCPTLVVSQTITFRYKIFFVFHQGQDREKLKLNRTWTLMFSKKCPNQFVVPSTSNHPHFPQQGHRAKNDNTSKGWTDSQVHHCSFQFCLPLNSSIFRAVHSFVQFSH